MKLGPMAEYYAKMIWRTSDTPGFKLFWLTQKYDAYSAISTLMREYIYLKAGIVARLIHLSSTKANKTDAELILTTVEQKLKMLYDAMPAEDTYTWGSNYDELIARINDYMATLPSEDLSAAVSSFVAYLSGQHAEYGKLIAHISPLYFVKYVEDYMLDKMVKYENKYSENENPAEVAADSKIETELMANVVADAIWSTSDYVVELRLNKYSVDYAVMMSTENIRLKEYMYLKAGIASKIIYEAVVNGLEANRVMSRALGILKDVYSTAPPSSHGGNYNELAERINEYSKARDLNEVARMFSRHLGLIIRAFGGSDRLINMLTSPKFVENVQRSMRANFIQFQRNDSGYNNGGGSAGSSSSGSGCLSVVVCFSLLIIAALALVCFE